MHVNGLSDRVVVSSSKVLAKDLARRKRLMALGTLDGRCITALIQVDLLHVRHHIPVPREGLAAGLAVVVLDPRVRLNVP